MKRGTKPTITPATLFSPSTETVTRDWSGVGHEVTNSDIIGDDAEEIFEGGENCASSKSPATTTHTTLSNSLSTSLQTMSTRRDGDDDVNMNDDEFTFLNENNNTPPITERNVKKLRKKKGTENKKPPQDEWDASNHIKGLVGGQSLMGGPMVPRKKKRKGNPKSTSFEDGTSPFQNLAGNDDSDVIPVHDKRGRSTSQQQFAGLTSSLNSELDNRRRKDNVRSHDVGALTFGKASPTKGR